MDFILHLVAGINLIYILKVSSKRKFFCVCDKVTFGSRTPQCLLGAFLHLFCMLLVLLEVPGYCFYPVSFWLFDLFFSGIYTYKSYKELCTGCALAYVLSLFLTVRAFLELSYTPYLVIGFYATVTFFSLCFTAASLEKNTGNKTC